MQFPSLKEVEMPLEINEFRQIEANYLNDKSPQSTFNYAWALVKSPRKNDQYKAIELLNGIYKSIPDRRRECLYYLSLAEYKVGNYKEARNYCQTLLQIEPKDSQARFLLESIEEQTTNQGLVGAAIVGGLIAGVAAVASALLSSKRK